jgi:hypothetical protein
MGHEPEEEEQASNAEEIEDPRGRHERDEPDRYGGDCNAAGAEGEGEPAQFLLPEHAP